MEQQRTAEPKNIIRQCEYLRVKGEKLAKTSGWVLWTWDQDRYFSELKEYCSFYEEMRTFLSNEQGHNEMIAERINDLPDIPFKDKSISVGGANLRMALLVILMFVFAPLVYLFMFSGMQYVNRTRRKILYADSLLSSIVFLLKAETN